MVNKLHKNTKDITGQVFGLWTVVSSSDEFSASRQMKWLCRCQCGDEHVRTGASLRNGSSEGCRKCKHLRMEKSASTGQFYTMRRGAERRGIEWLIDKDYFIKLIEEQNYSCKLTGLPSG
jgi:hypothetical protein